jgi:hypothetical protein
MEGNGMEPIGTIGSYRLGNAGGSRARIPSEGPAFEEVLARAVGEFDKASGRTTTLIRELWDVQGMTEARTRDGVHGVHIGDVAANRDRALSKLTAACDSLFADYGIDTRQDISFSVGQDGRINVVEPHSQKGLIEDLVNNSRLLRNTIVKVMNDTRLVSQVDNLGSVNASSAGSTAEAILVTFSNSGKGLTAEVQTASSRLARKDDDDEAAKEASKRQAGRPIGELLDDLAGIAGA